MPRLQKMSPCMSPCMSQLMLLLLHCPRALAQLASSSTAKEHIMMKLNRQLQGRPYVGILPLGLLQHLRPLGGV